MHLRYLIPSAEWRLLEPDLPGFSAKLVSNSRRCYSLRTRTAVLLLLRDVGKSATDNAVGSVELYRSKSHPLKCSGLP